MKHQDICISVL